MTQELMNPHFLVKTEAKELEDCDIQQLLNPVGFALDQVPAPSEES